MGEMRIEGLVDVTRALERGTDMDDIKKVVKYHGAALQQSAVEHAIFRGHYEGSKFIKPTGNLRRSIGLELTEFGMTAEVEASAHYAPYVELGTRFMKAQPYLKPAHDKVAPEFIRDLKRLLG